MEKKSSKLFVVSVKSLHIEHKTRSRNCMWNRIALRINLWRHKNYTTHLWLRLRAKVRFCEKPVIRCRNDKTKKFASVQSVLVFRKWKSNYRIILIVYVWKIQNDTPNSPLGYSGLISDILQSPCEHFMGHNKTVVRSFHICLLN
jgi:hypothetical protein